jgi:hypothetical protein
MPLSDIVQVSITRTTQSLSTADFGTIAIVGPNLTAGTRVTTWSTADLTSLAAALTGGDTADEYLAALAIAQQSPRPASFKIIHKGEAEGFDDALAAAILIDQLFYGIIITSRTPADVLEAAVWVEANQRVFITASAVTRNVDTAQATDDGTDEVADSISAIINARGYDRTAVLYHEDAADEYPDAGMLAVFLIRRPGTYTGMFKKITGFATSNLTPTYSTNALAKKCNIYETIGGKMMIREATVGSGEFFDVIHFCDWFQARMTEAIFGLLARTEKVPFSPEGLVSIRGEMDTIGQLGIDIGGFTKTRYDEDTGEQLGGYLTIMPDFDDIGINDKATRTLNNVEFKAFLAGAIHKVMIYGTVTL